MNYNCLGIIYTYKCNFNCSICCFNCSPYLEEKIKYKEAFNVISSAIDLGIGLIGFIGGEPFLYYDEILNLMKNFKNKAVFTITTNGYWATSIVKTEEIVKELVTNGLRGLKLSIDEYHLKNIDIQNIKNILNICKSYNIRVIIGSTILSESKVSNFLDELKIELADIGFFFHYCYPIGRAKEVFKEENFITNKNIKIKYYEPNTITVAPNGDVYPCGSMLGIVKRRKLGNINEDNLMNIVNNKNKNISDFENYLKTEYLKFKDKGIDFIDTCHICYEIHKD